jgi:hypothetical protein
VAAASGQLHVGGRTPLVKCSGSQRGLASAGLVTTQLTTQHKDRMKYLLAVVVAAFLISTAPASAATPVSPANGAQLVDQGQVVLSWVNDPGQQTYCIEWSRRPETRYAGGRFLVPEGGDCSISGGGYDVGRTDTSFLLSDLTQGRYYWHVASCTTTVDDFSDEDCDNETYSPTVYFDNIEKPAPDPKTLPVRLVCNRGYDEDNDYAGIYRAISKPRSCFFTRDKWAHYQTASIVHATYRHWGEPVAYAYATLTYNMGYRHHVKVKLYRPRVDCTGRYRVYTRAQVMNRDGTHKARPISAEACPTS